MKGIALSYHLYDRSSRSLATYQLLLQLTRRNGPLIELYPSAMRKKEKRKERKDTKSARKRACVCVGAHVRNDNLAVRICFVSRSHQVYTVCVAKNRTYYLVFGVSWTFAIIKRKGHRHLFQGRFWTSEVGFESREHW